MAVLVSFITPRGIGAISAPGVGDCRVCENITVPGTTTATALPGEMVLISSGEAALVRAAHGTAPDAAAADRTSATSAGYPVPPGILVPVVPKAGDKISIKALS